MTATNITVGYLIGRFLVIWKKKAGLENPAGSVMRKQPNVFDHVGRAVVWKSLALGVCHGVKLLSTSFV
jgi:hypothetical protein